MLKGHIDTLTTADAAEGWAFDTTSQIPALEIQIRGPGDEVVGHGYANLFRKDLADVEFGLGWCAFRIRLAGRAPALRSQRLTLRAVQTGEDLYTGEEWAMRDDFDQAYTSVEQAVAEDPTVLRSISTLNGCQALFATFVKKRGVSEFVRAAYAYVLGRAADHDGLLTYARMLRNGAITPFGLLTALSESAEFRSRSRLLAPPTSASFVFRC